MKTKLFLIAVIALLCISCRPMFDFNELPVVSREIRKLTLLNYPVNSDDFILCAGNLDPENTVEFALRDCFTNELISCVDSLGNLKDYIVLYLGEALYDSDSIYQPDGNEYYVKIYIAEDKDIDYKKQNKDFLNDRLDTIEVDIDDKESRLRIYSLKIENKEQWLPITATEKLLSYRLLNLGIIPLDPIE